MFYLQLNSIFIKYIQWSGNTEITIFEIKEIFQV